ncbi:MAG: hypothetical protein ACTHU0_17885 [Kofleriaceae bacterium]
MPRIRSSWFVVAAVTVASLAAEARADWPCEGETRWRIAHSAKDRKPIAIGPFADDRLEAVDRPIYGELAFEDLNGDGRKDVVFHSACITSPGERTRVHRVLASCGARPGDPADEYVVVFEEEELCERAVAIAPAGKPPKSAKPAAEDALVWRELKIQRKQPKQPRSTEVLRFDGRRYR